MLGQNPPNICLLQIVALYAMTTLTKCSLSLLAVIVGGVTLIFFFVPFPGDTIEAKEYHFGEIESFSIGESKEDVLVNNSLQSFAPYPKPIECLKNWIDVSAMDKVQKKCLLDSNEWKIGFVRKELCPKGTDQHGTLYFSAKMLSKVKIRCTVAI